MKDNWTKAFQEKLGNFELDLPEPAAAGRRSARIVPLLLALAAAALLLMVLLRMPGKSQPGPSRLIAEAGPDIEASLPGQIVPIAPLPKRVHPVAATQKAAMPEPTKPVEPVADEEKAAGETVPASVPKTEKTVSAQAVNDKWAEDWPEDKTHRSTRISYRVHFDPSLLRNQTTVEKTFRQLDFFYGLKEGLIMENPLSVGETAHDIPKGELRCDLPVKAGVSIQIGWPGRFSVGSGLDYSFHRSRIGSSSSSELEYRMHYLGLPVKGIFTIVDAKRLNWYAAAGGELEWMVAGRIHTRQPDQQETVSPIDIHPFIFSLTASTGLEFKFSEHVGLYAEPGIAWHTLMTDKLPDYYLDHPVSFDLHMGVRFDLGVR